SLLIALLSPLLIYLAARIKADGGPAFFFQKRVGLDAKPFRCMKFRSMHIDAEEQLASMLRDNPALSEEWQRNHKLESDPRITSVGKLLRSKSLDELPQLFNVLLGQMSLVGPRPLIFDELPRYGKASDLYRLVRPGMTGVWQVSGRSDTTFEERASMDEWYIRNWSLFYDVTCLIRTINVVLDSDGAY
ncbi:MAG: sugar transferase, partial [Luminiphilus sp.]|nr:sugar transferase [Luminiphilus sp.]